MLVMLILLQSILVILQKAGNSLSAPSPAAPPSVLPSRSFGVLIAAVGAHRDGEWRPVVHHVDRDRRFCGLFGGELDQRIDVAEADVIGAVGHQRDRRAGAVALVHGDVEAGGFEIAAVVGEEKPALRALVFPVQHHFQLGFGGRRRGVRKRDGSRERGGERETQRRVIEVMTGSCCGFDCCTGVGPGHFRPRLIAVDGAVGRRRHVITKRSMGHS